MVLIPFLCSVLTKTIICNIVTTDFWYNYHSPYQNTLSAITIWNSILYITVCQEHRAVVPLPKDRMSTPSVDWWVSKRPGQLAMSFERIATLDSASFSTMHLTLRQNKNSIPFKSHTLFSDLHLRTASISELIIDAPMSPILVIISLAAFDIFI